MKLKAKHTHLRLLIVSIAVVLVAVAADDETPLASPPKQALSGCNYTCGDIEIPYPFGIGISSTDQKTCYLDSKFSLKCNNSRLYWGNVRVNNISIDLGEMDVLFNISRKCYRQDGSSFWSYPWLHTASFSISSTENKFITVGCNNYGYLNSNYNDEVYSTGCLTRCNGGNRMINNGTCSGIGCCQVDIPPRMRNITVQAFAFGFSNSTEEWLGSCSYSFVAKSGSYNFSVQDLVDLPYPNFPLVIDWTVGDKSCNVSEKGSDYVCKKNSYCDDEGVDVGYRCRCKPGFEGNPYHPDGCIDIDECKSSNNICIDEHHCLNTNGNYTCFCPEGETGTGTKEGSCQKSDVRTKVIIGVGAGFIVLFVATALLYLMYQRRKLIKLKEKFFNENGGFILLQQLRAREDSSQSAQIFTEDELKKATSNYDEGLIIGRGGYGIVFKGILSDKRIVAIKKSRIADKSQIEQFINEVVVLSQINHRNVVKLLGCCLETEVPLLVYEFVSNGTLHDFIHSEGKVDNVTWKTRLRIAAEAAGALSYLHSAASVPIIHRDVKGANILLDDAYTAKVSDFGASRLVPLDQTNIATMVQGTIGYLDPEYMQTQQLTEKSDVYSFGVVLVELLTGEKPISFDRPEEKRSLAMHFLSCLKEDRLFEVVQVEIMNEENKQEIKEVAILAARCLRLRGDERPSMKEVTMELEGLRLIEKHPWTSKEQDLDETQYLLGKASSSIYETGDSSNFGYTTGYDSLKDNVPVALNDGR
ncbi:wall-associated receptor kinase 2-like [Lotus japonicus]|uniref:wall-associated receptor kinase 2-like n=1 Tax=Lotus japonicus TaxID=34305 RepID=UPI002582672F|nr:wall-associated receptor kinase 2-like [Lotus japonicus]